MSVLLDIAIGLVVVFLLFSIAVSGLAEWLAQCLGLRGNFLRLGMQRLMNDAAVYRRVLHHPLVGSLYRERAGQGKPPSYVAPANFAFALAQVLLERTNPAAAQARATRPLSVAAVREALRDPVLAASPISAALVPIVDRAQDDLDAMLKGFEAWFGGAMDRVGGWYKARTQKHLFAIGLVLAVLCNVDTIEIVGTLKRSPEVRAVLVRAGQSAVQTRKIGGVDIAALETRAPTQAEWASLRPVVAALGQGSEMLPIGYACLGVALDPPAAANAAGAGDAAAPGPWQACTEELQSTWQQRTVSAWILKLIGWVLTALAGTLGAAYWFGLLSKAIDVRGSGSKPPAKTGAADGAQ